MGKKIKLASSFVALATTDGFKAILRGASVPERDLGALKNKEAYLAKIEGLQVEVDLDHIQAENVDDAELNGVERAIRDLFGHKSRFLKDFTAKVEEALARSRPAPPSARESPGLAIDWENASADLLVSTPPADGPYNFQVFVKDETGTDKPGWVFRIELKLKQGRALLRFKDLLHKLADDDDYNRPFRVEVFGKKGVITVGVVTEDETRPEDETGSQIFATSLPHRNEYEPWFKPQPGVLPLLLRVQILQLEPEEESPPPPSSPPLEAPPPRKNAKPDPPADAQLSKREKKELDEKAAQLYLETNYGESLRDIFERPSKQGLSVVDMYKAVKIVGGLLAMKQSQVKAHGIKYATEAPFFPIRPLETLTGRKRPWLLELREAYRIQIQIAEGGEYESQTFVELVTRDKEKLEKEWEKVGMKFYMDTLNKRLAQKKKKNKRGHDDDDDDEEPSSSKKKRKTARHNSG